WNARLGHYFPFVTNHAATYPIPASDLRRLFLDYPKLVFVGSDLGTTLFGTVPYLLVALLALKVVARWLPAWLRARGPVDFARWDRLDVLMVTVYGVFFVLLNFVPNGFQLDHYYSAPRIFRYLAPISFALSLHAAKMLLDMTSVIAPQRFVLVGVVLAPMILNVVQAAEATEPGRDYRTTFLAIRDEIRRTAPPMVVAESVVADWFRHLYLADGHTAVTTPYATYAARDYEAWLRKTQSQWPEGTVLITGLCSYVFYGAQQDGFRLRLFSRPLPPEWVVSKDYGMMSHLPDPVQVWRLSRTSAPTAPPPEPELPVTGDTPEAWFANGTKHFDAGEYPVARAHFRAVFDRFPAGLIGQDARYFYAVSYFRERRWQEAKGAFEDL